MLSLVTATHAAGTARPAFPAGLLFTSPKGLASPFHRAEVLEQIPAPVRALIR